MNKKYIVMILLLFTIFVFNVGVSICADIDIFTDGIIENGEWLERIKVNKEKPKAGETITIEGFGWIDDKYKDKDGITITLSRTSGGSELVAGRVRPDATGYFKIRCKLPENYAYNEVIEIRCKGNGIKYQARALLLIKD